MAAPQWSRHFNAVEYVRQAIFAPWFSRTQRPTLRP